VAEWLRSGLQIRVHRFDSGPRLHFLGLYSKPMFWVWSLLGVFMRAFYLLILIGLASVSAACEQQGEISSSANDRPATDQLSQNQAIARKARVSEVSYTLDIDLISLGDAYQGSVTVGFMLGDNDTSLNVDFTGGIVTQVILNGETLEADYNGYFISLPANYLNIGINEAIITYSHPYDQDGTGLHRFVDPEDGNTYLYTYLWPYYSNRLFPNFDQPDIKATYELTVRAADGWQVISTTIEDNIATDGTARIWHFPRTLPFSSYIFSLHAGPYEIWEDMAGEIPIRLMARQSLAQYVEAEEWLRYTKAGLAHYADYFDIPYPFGKYDQIIVPDFLIGAMENVAAVTFSESYVDRGPTTRFRSQRRGGTILHEMAHMWFGDLVTMKWWNGLWLNESFATLMSAIAMSDATEFTDMWHDFYLSGNLRAIEADNAVSTHPIEGPVNSTNDFFNIFDAITYQKGASVLNQLSHYVGRENFRLGVSSYLKEHSWGNTELADFMDAQSAQSGINLTPWAEDWMYQAGVNTLEARFSCEAGLISEMGILQRAPDDYPRLRDQRVQIGLLKANDDGAVEPYAAMVVNVTGEYTTVAAAVGLDCPVLVYPNYQGWGYAEVALDAVSVANLLNDISVNDIEDPLLRSMIWTALFQAPANGQMENAALLDLIIESLPIEANDRIIRQVLRELAGNFDLLERLGADFAEELTTFGPRAEARLWSQIEGGLTDGGQTGSLLNLRLDYYIAMTRSDAALANLAGLLSGAVTVDGLDVDQGLRWSMIGRLAGRRYGEAVSLIAAERQIDTSDTGRIAAIRAEAALADMAIKQGWIDRFFVQDEPLPLSHQGAAMAALFPTGQEAMQTRLLPQLAAALNEMAGTHDNYYLRAYGRDLFAGICDGESLTLLTQALADKDQLGTTLYRFLSVNEQQAQACLVMKMAGRMD
jgi:aminopeptidase N